MKTPVRKHFPDPRWADANGVVAVGVPVNNETLFEAYRHGIFPWPHEDYPMLWFSPDPRAVLDFRDLHIPESLKKFRRKTDLCVTFDQAFDEVIEACARAKRPGQKGTWISREIIEAYREFHRAGHCYSVECWQGDRLVGGLYGCQVAGVFSGESMFHLVPNASKLALVTLCERLREQGLKFLDIQQLSPTLKALGAKEIPRSSFLKRYAVPFS